MSNVSISPQACWCSDPDCRANGCRAQRAKPGLCAAVAAHKATLRLHAEERRYWIKRAIRDFAEGLAMVDETADRIVDIFASGIETAKPPRRETGSARKGESPVPKADAQTTAPRNPK